MTDEQIKYMVDRFLRWRLPESFSPDNGISFKKTFNDGTPYQMDHNPVGTNLFDAREAEAMVRHMVEGMPEEPRLAAIERLARQSGQAFIADEIASLLHGPGITSGDAQC